MYIGKCLWDSELMAYFFCCSPFLSSGSFVIFLPVGRWNSDAKGNKGKVKHLLSFFDEVSMCGSSKQADESTCLHVYMHFKLYELLYARAFINSVYKLCPLFLISCCRLSGPCVKYQFPFILFIRVYLCFTNIHIVILYESVCSVK